MKEYFKGMLEVYDLSEGKIEKLNDKGLLDFDKLIKDFTLRLNKEKDKKIEEK